MRISNKISLSFFIVAMILTFAGASYFYITAKTSLTERINAHLQTTVASRAYHIETFLAGEKTQIKLLAESDHIEMLTKGIIRHETDTEKFVEKTNSFLKDFVEQGTKVNEVFILDPNGKVIASTIEKNIGTDESADSSFLGALKETFIKDIHYAEKTGEWEFDFSTAITDDHTGEILGVLVFMFKTTVLDGITTDRTGLGETGEIYLINKYGYMITPSRFKKDVVLRQKVDTINSDQCLTMQDKKHKHLIGIFSDYRGESVLGTHKHISDMKWCLIAEIDVKEAMAPVFRLRVAFISLLLIVPFAALLMGFVIARRITGPIHKLQKGIGMIGQGNLDYNVGTQANDEIGQLSRAFDNMTNDLKTSTTSIDRLNEEIKERERAEAEVQQKQQELEKTNKTIDENRRNLQGALSEVSSLINQVIQQPDRSVRFVNPHIKKCYEIKNCEKEDCPCFGKEAMRCWKIAGTYCGGEVQGVFAQKYGNCSICEVYKEATIDPVYQIGELFNNMMHILEIKNKELKEAYAELKEAEETIRYEFKIQKIINELLNIFQANVSLNEMLERTIIYLTSIPWLSPEQKGAIFLVEDEPGMLELKAHHGLAGPLPELCARVPFGQCLCGRAASSGKIEFADGLDERHEIAFEGIGDHGHYCVPILSIGNKLYGVLTLYTEAGHKHNDAEVAVLMAIANTLAGAIERRKMEKVLSGKEEQLRQAYMDLKTSQSHVIQQEKMASIGQLAAGVAHEINNPIGFVSSNLGTFKKYIEKISEFINALTEAINNQNGEETAEELKEKRRQLKIDYILEDIEPMIAESLDGTDRVKRIVQNLKSFSRVDEADYKMADLNECMEITLNIIWNELKYKSTVKKDYGEIPLTRCYPQQLNQVFMNLLVNAVQAIDKQGEITIKTWSSDVSIYVSISDTGNGIPEDRIEKIFDPFFTTKEVGKGTGLGLSITYDIVKKHGGDITVDSEVGKGTTFTIKLPVVEEK